MLSLPASVRVYLCTAPADLRKSFDGLSALVQQRLCFGAGEALPADLTVVSAATDEELLAEYVVRRQRRRAQPRSEQLPEHLERRTERIEPQLPAGVKREDCKPLGVDIV